MPEVHDYIIKNENAYKTIPVPVVDGYEWSMFDHVKTTTLYLNSRFKTGNQDMQPFRNIILPKVNLEHRAVQFDLDELQFYIDSDENYKSFLVKKFHDRWALQHGIADFLDELSETYTDYGGVLVRDLPETMEVVPFQRLAFCDQTDMTAGPICQKHEYSPDQLKEMESVGWGDPNSGATGTIDQVIALAQENKGNTQTDNSGTVSQVKARTPGRYIEVYDLEGMLPANFVDPEADPDTFIHQLQIVTFYTDSKGEKHGITLFAGKAKNTYKAYRRDKIFGRALGRGAVEELFEPQVWVNYTEIQKTEMLEQVSKVLNWTNDPSFKAKNDTSDLKSGDVLVVGEGKTFAQLNLSAVNAEAFENAIQSWDSQAQQIAAATDPITGEAPKSNTTGEAQTLQNEEAHSLHEYRKGRLSTFVAEIYRDWVIPRVQRAIAGGAEFLSNLSTDEMGQLVDQVVAHEFNKTMVTKVLAGEIVYPDDAKSLQDSYRQQFFKSGNRKLITILEGEIKDLPLEVEVNITGKQRNMQLRAQKVSQIFTQAVTALQVNPNFFTEHPEMAKLFNEIVESYGLSALTFGMNGTLPVPGQQPQQPQQPQLNQPNVQPEVPSQPQAA